MKLTKYDRKLVSQGAAAAGKRFKSQSRAKRLTGVSTALAVAKLDAAVGDMAPSFTLPVLGETKLQTILAGVVVARYATARTVSNIESAAGFGAIALLARAM